MDPGDASLIVFEEMSRARKKFGAFNSAHEGISVIREEFEELWDEIKHSPKDWRKIQEEAVQMDAMGLRFLVDLENMRRNYP